MKRLLIIAALSCLLPEFALADGTDALPSDSRIKLLMYDEADIYTITTRFGYQTNIVFGPEEEVQTISVGDRSMWQIIPSSNRLFIRPMEDGGSTNMTVLTNRHSYQFDLKSSAADKDTGIVYVAKFIYPDAHPKMQATIMPPPAHPAPPPAVAAMPAPALAPAPAPVGDGNTQPLHQNYNYSYSGPDQLAPLQVYDDGNATYVKFRSATQPLPTPFSADATGAEQPVSYTIRDDTMVIDRVAGTLVFKSAAGMVRVYNETLNPANASTAR